MTTPTTHATPKPHPSKCGKCGKCGRCGRLSPKGRRQGQMHKNRQKGIARKMHKTPVKWLCVDCKEDTRMEHYYVTPEVWYFEAGMPEVGMLCVGCLEARIGRELGRRDFPPCHLNNPRTHQMTMRLLNRLRRA